MTTVDVVFDTETGDPDDGLTLIRLLDHPGVNLKAVTITPGTQDQIDIIGHILNLFNSDIPIGFYDKDSKKQDPVGGWFNETFKDRKKNVEAVSATKLFDELIDDNTTLFTGAPLHNLGKTIANNPEFKLNRWVCQGGFAGDNLVKNPLPKFAGKITCPTFNLNGHPKHSLRCINHPHIKEKRFVSKNVCHGLIYDKQFHERMESVVSKRKSLQWIYEHMEDYLKRNPRGKKLHDPLAMTALLEPAVCSWTEAIPYREKGLWGSQKAPGNGSWITIAADHDKFFEVFTR